MKKIAILGSQVPFAHGGAELLVESLAFEINKIDRLEADIIKLPYKWYPEEQLLADIAAWRMLDISEAQGKKIDIIIPTKFPSYAAKHDNKVTWLVHQHRQFYELEGGEYDCADNRNNDVRQKVRELDSKFFGEAKALFSIARTVSNRAKKYNNADMTPLYPPPPLANKIKSGNYGDYILYIGRLDRLKRVDILIEALTIAKNAKIKIIGGGADKERLQGIAQMCGLATRCEFLGFAPEELLLSELAGCRGVYYAPFDEDYGYAAIEAWLAKKPLITAVDSGEPALFAKDSGGGWICKPTKDSIAEALKRCYDMSDSELLEIGLRGYEVVKEISWKNIIQKLVLENL